MVDEHRPIEVLVTFHSDDPGIMMHFAHIKCAEWYSSLADYVHVHWVTARYIDH